MLLKTILFIFEMNLKVSLKHTVLAGTEKSWDVYHVLKSRSKWHIPGIGCQQCIRQCKYSFSNFPGLIDGGYKV